MCEQSIRDRTGRVWTGRLTDHLGAGLAEVDVDGKRYVGVKIDPVTLTQANNGCMIHRDDVTSRARA